ncbi:MAG: hypothetical protein KC563_04425 [Nitrospira sp.]|nr:hypothetical protein [Nitrospira sp.]MDR4488476.1 hypothetical protein [Nitrospirales bacterium]
MPDFIYDKNSQTLCGFGKTWRVRSGGKSDAALKSKVYTVPPLALMVGTEQASGAIHHSKYDRDCFKDQNGLGWFLWLGEGGLGIHPNGNDAGTQGCIGIVNSCTRDLFDLLRERSNQALSVLVE